MTDRKQQTPVAPQRPRAHGQESAQDNPSAPSRNGVSSADDTPTSQIPKIEADLQDSVARTQNAAAKRPNGADSPQATPPRAPARPAGPGKSSPAKDTGRAEPPSGPREPSGPHQAPPAVASPSAPLAGAPVSSPAPSPQSARSAAPSPAPAKAPESTKAPEPAKAPEPTTPVNARGSRDRSDQPRTAASSPPSPSAGATTTGRAARTRADVPTAGTIAGSAETVVDQPSVAPAQQERRPKRPKPYEDDKPKAKTSSSSIRKAHLRLVRLDPWSVMKIAFALSVALAVVTVVAMTIVWTVLGAAGVWDAINSSVATVMSDNADDFDITKYVGFGRIIGLTIVVSAIDIILITAIATVGAFLYNLAAGLLGGLEVTLAEDS